MICSICKKEMSISEVLVEIDGKRCHKSCKTQREKQWRKERGLSKYG